MNSWRIWSRRNNLLVQGVCGCTSYTWSSLHLTWVDRWTVCVPNANIVCSDWVAGNTIQPESSWSTIPLLAERGTWRWPPLKLSVVDFWTSAVRWPLDRSTFRVSHLRCGPAEWNGRCLWTEISATDSGIDGLWLQSKPKFLAVLARWALGWSSTPSGWSRKAECRRIASLFHGETRLSPWTTCRWI